MTLSLNNTSFDPRCPLRQRKTSELRVLSPAFSGDRSSESVSESLENLVEDSSETIDSLIQGLAVEPDFEINIDELDIPLTMAEAANRLGLKGGTQSATHRITRLSTRFPLNLLKNGKQLTALGWDLMQGLSSKSVDELWEEFQSTIVQPEPEPEPETVDVEIMDNSEVGAAIVLRTQAIRSSIQDVEPPTIVLGQHLDQLIAHYKAAGEQMGHQLGAVFQSGVAQGFQSVVTQGTIGGLKQ